MRQQLKERAEAMAASHFAHLEAPVDFRVDIAPGDAHMLLTIGSEEETTALDRLRQNALPNGPWTAAPVVFDPETATPAHRFVIPYRLWAQGEGLKQLFSESGRPVFVSRAIAAVRLLRDIPEELSECQYGRGGRLKIVIGPRTMLLTAKIFPGSLYELALDTHPERLELAARVLLARSGIRERPWSFHRLASRSLFYVERAVTLWEKLSDTRLKSLETSLLRQADDDRNILKALLDPDVPLAQLIHRNKTNR